MSAGPGAEWRIVHRTLAGRGTIQAYSETTIEARPELAFDFETLICQPPKFCIVTRVVWGDEKSTSPRVEVGQRVAVTFRNMGSTPCDVIFVAMGPEVKG